MRVFGRFSGFLGEQGFRSIAVLGIHDSEDIWRVG